MFKKTLILTLVMLSFWGVLVQHSLGKEYPTKPIELICPYPPGGSIDIITRFVAEKASKYLGQPVIVVNKAGAGGSIAAADVISSKPDGYKLVVLSTTFFATTTKTQKIPFDPNDLIPIASIWLSRNVMVVRSDSPLKTLTDLFDYARKNPGKLSWGHPGRGIVPTLNTLLILRKADVETIEVPYKGASELIVSFLGGHVDAMSVSSGSIIEHEKAGMLRLLVALSDRRYSNYPNLPCATELGFPEVGKLQGIFGLYVHKDTPEKIKETLIDFSKKIFEDPEFSKTIEKFGEEPRFGGPEFVKETIKKAEEVGVPLLKELGIYVGK